MKRPTIDRYARARLYGQLLAAGMALRGFACSYDRRFVMSAPVEGTPSAAECKKLCMELVGRREGCSVVAEVDSCEVAFEPPEPGDAGSGPAPAGAHKHPFVVCKMTMDPRYCAAGRRPAGLLVELGDDGVSDALGVGAHLSSLAALEAAAIDAFLALHVELAAHGAPEAFVEGAVAAALEEVRHAEGMARLALRFEVAPARPAVGTMLVRSLEAVALENAVEGCVREAHGARVAMLQARGAADPEVRAVMAAIATEEASHAALSRRLDEWFLDRLPPVSRRRIAEAKARAAWEMREGLGAQRDPAYRALVGLPSIDHQVSLVA